MQYTRHGHACLGLCGQHGEDYWWCSKSRRLPLPNLNLAEDGQVQTTRLRTIGGSIARPASTAPGEPSLLASSEVVVLKRVYYLLAKGRLQKHESRNSSDRGSPPLTYDFRDSGS